MTVNDRQDDATDETGSSSSAWNHYIPFFDGTTTGSMTTNHDIEKQSQSPTTQKQTEQSSSSSVTPNMRQQWNTFWAMSIPYFYENREGRCLFIGLIILMLLDSFAKIFFSYLARDFWSALGDKDAEQFYFVMKEFLIALLCLAPINVFYRFQRQRLAIKWRKWMTDRILYMYFYNPHQIYYRLERQQDTTNECYVDNPDQRLAEDVRSFTQYSLSLFLTIAISCIDLTAFSIVLYTIEPMLFISILGFATFGTIMTIVLGKDLVRLNFERLQKEADFRFSLIRIRENAESIAFFRGESTEGHEVKRRFSNVVSVFYDLIGTQRNLEFFTTNYNYLTWILPVVVIAPQYMAGNVELGVVQQAAAAFGHILDDLSLIINQFEELSEFSASIGRLHQFVRAVRDADPDRDEYSPLMGSPHSSPDDDTHGDAYNQGSSEKDGIFKKTSTPPVATVDGEEIIHNNDGICLRQFSPLLSAAADPTSSSGSNSTVSSTTAALSIRNLCLYTPDQNRTLIHSLDLELKWGQQLLIVGQSGIGKSSLLRAIAGLWTSGSGIIERANTSDVYFLPQKPYCPIGTLRDQLLYPFRTTVEDEGDENKESRITDERLLQILGEVDLSNLAIRSGEGDPIRGLDTIVDWSNVLSLGEQQRLAFGRVLVNQPRLVIVDEATSAMDVTAEERMYGLIQNLTYVSVGHRPSLLKYHHKRLHLQKSDNNPDSHCNFTFDDIRSTSATGVINDEVNLFFR
jgi:putative ATP-binding cassette transporter